MRSCSRKKGSEREVLSVEDVAFSNSEILKPTSLCITSCHEFNLVVSKEIQGIVHEVAPDHRSVLSPIPEIQIDIGKSDNHVIKHTIQFGGSTHRERERNELRHLEERKAPEFLRRGPRHQGVPSSSYKDLRFGFDGTRSLIPLAYMFSDAACTQTTWRNVDPLGILGCTDIACKVLREITLAPTPGCTPSTVIHRRRPRDSPPPMIPPLSKIYGNYEAASTTRLTPCTCHC
ncbi:hypothetical protein AAG906_021248 [Vitis piasezkii]